MMKTKKTKLQISVAAAVLAVCMCMAITAYAMWNSELSVTGSVSARGNWSVKITDAALELSNAGAKQTYDVIVYPIQVKYVDVNDNYIYEIDDTSPKSVSVTADELAEYSQYVFISSSSGNFYKSGENPKGRYSFQVKTNENFTKYPVFPAKAQDGGAGNSTLVGEAIAWCREGQSTPVEGGIVTLTYQAAKNYLANTVTITDDSVEFAAVDFSLPGAWANYIVTVTNESSVNANLSNYTVAASELSDIFAVSVPDLDDDVLAPGESCTFNVVVQVTAEGGFAADEAPFSIHLTYAQDTVNEAPAAAHTH